jgi:hypothetical protein
MGDSIVRLFQTQADEEAAPPDAPKTCERACPLCNGPLLRLDGSARCRVCQFSFCDGCDGGPDERSMR